MKRVAIFTFIMSGFLISASAEIDVLKPASSLQDRVHGVTTQKGSLLHLHLRR